MFKHNLKILGICLFASAATLSTAAHSQSDPNKTWYTVFHNTIQGKKKPVQTYGDQSYSCRNAKYAYVTSPNMRANYSVPAPYGFSKRSSRIGKKSTGAAGGWCPKSIGSAACETREKNRIIRVERGNSWSNTCISVYWKWGANLQKIEGTP